MKHYPLPVKVLAVRMRKEGRKWSDIRDAIEEQFQIKAPTARTMQNWGKGTESDLIDRELEAGARHEAKVVKEATLKQTIDELIPNLVRAQEMGDDVEYAVWHWFFSVIITMMGKDKFWRFIKKYRKFVEESDRGVSEEK